jgi:hypothetical protein
MHKKLLTVVGITILFLGLAIQPSIATVQPVEKTIDVEPKDYLFQTIIDIANNPNVKNLFEQNKYDSFKVDINRSVYRKLLLRNPRLFRSLIFTKPSLSVGYLNKCYNNGIEITNILGEDKAIEIAENVEVADKELFDGLNNIITKDKEISNRIAILNERYKDIKLDTPWDFPVICTILLLIYFPLVLVADVLAFTWLGILYSGNRLLTIIFGLCLVPLWIFFIGNVLIQELFGCWP